MDYKTIFGITALVISFVGYLPYFRDVISKKTKPHIFSWFIWSLTGGIGFFAQIISGAGSAAWILGLGFIICSIITILAFRQGEKSITLTDWIAFSGSLLALILWRLTSNPLMAIIFITVTDILAFIPTFRKGYYKPYEETLISWFFSSFKFIFVLVAIQTYSLTTVFYPAYLFLSNGSFVIMLLLRRKALDQTKN
jgi:hypothetical protein